MSLTSLYTWSHWGRVLIRIIRSNITYQFKIENSEIYCAPTIRSLQLILLINEPKRKNGVLLTHVSYAVGLYVKFEKFLFVFHAIIIDVPSYLN